MGDQAIVWLYAAQVTALFVLALSAGYRLWLNHIDRKQIRWALIAFGTTMGLLAVTLVYRTVARNADPAESRHILNSWHFWVLNIGWTISLVWLFLVLQKPRK